jgi:cysteine desulfurase/selenocysteine lyase
MAHRRSRTWTSTCRTSAATSTPSAGTRLWSHGHGVLYGREELLERMPPWQGGGEMIDQVTFEKTTYAKLPFKFEAGTPHIAGIIGLGEAFRWMQDYDKSAMAAHELDLLEHATKELLTIDGLRIIGTAKEKVGVISFVIDGPSSGHHYDLGTLLDQQGIAVRTGHHCTQPLMERFGVSGTTRASFACFNTIAELMRWWLRRRRPSRCCDDPSTSSGSLTQAQQEVVDEFAMFSDWQDRYEHLIELGKDLPLIAPEKKTEENIVKGCQSRVWLSAEQKNGLVHFTADSDAMITKGIVALLVRVLNDRTPQEILNTPLTFIDTIGLREHLSPNRSNGLVAMLDQMKRFAVAFLTSENSGS